MKQLLHFLRTKLLFIIFILVYHNANAAVLKKIAVVKKPVNVNDIAFNQSQFWIDAKKISNGNIIINLNYAGMGPYSTFVLHPSGAGIEIIREEIIREENSKIIGTVIENSVLKVINERTTVGITSIDSGDLQLKTLSTNGYQSVKNQSVATRIQRIKQSADKIELIDSKDESSSRFVISNHKIDGQVISQEIFEGKYAPAIVPDFNENPNNGYAIQIKEGMLHIYVVENIINQSNSNGLSIRITKSQQNSIIGIIQSSNSKDVRVQSSQNISDWIDIEKITNPNGKEIVIPFSKEKEFIRIIE